MKARASRLWSLLIVAGAASCHGIEGPINGPGGVMKPYYVPYIENLTLPQTATVGVPVSVGLGVSMTLHPEVLANPEYVWVSCSERAGGEVRLFLYLVKAEEHGLPQTGLPPDPAPAPSLVFDAAGQYRVKVAGEKSPELGGTQYESTFQA